MLRSLIAAMSLIILCCPVGCAPREEDTADLGQPSAPAPEDGLTAVPPVHDARANPEERLDVRALPMINPVLNVEPMTRWRTELGRFVITNEGSDPVMLGTVTVDFHDLCSVLETVTLEEDGTVASDSACREAVEFTLDRQLAPQEHLYFTVSSLSATGLDGTLAAIRAKRTNPHRGIAVTGVRTGTKFIGIEYAESTPVIVQDETHADTNECFETESDTDMPTVGVRFTLDPDHDIRPVQDTLFDIPFRIESMNLDPLGPPVTLAVHLTNSDIAPTTALVTSMGANRIVWQVPIHDGALDISIPADMAIEEHAYRLLVFAPQIRGTTRFVINAQDIAAPAGTQKSGCYPSYSDTLLVLPPNEWQTYE